MAERAILARDILARAKVNLTLHVGAAIQSGRHQGYHPVESLVAFADFGDELTAVHAPQSSMSIAGPFGAGLTAGEDNLVFKALSQCGVHAQSIHLTKNIPVSAGLGGGSANAAAILRVFDPVGAVDPLALGADVPVCRRSETAMMEGIGERVTPLPGLGTVAAVIANPGRPVSTAQIFSAFDAQTRPENPSQTARRGTLIERARSGGNDLQPIAVSLVPDIAGVIEVIAAQPGCELARMSGSGASVFGLFGSDEAAKAAEDRLTELRTNDPSQWGRLWARACRLGDVQ